MLKVPAARPTFSPTSPRFLFNGPQKVVFASRSQEGKDVRSGLDEVKKKIELLGKETNDIQTRLTQVSRSVVPFIAGNDLLSYGACRLNRCQGILNVFNTTLPHLAIRWLVLHGWVIFNFRSSCCMQQCRGAPPLCTIHSRRRVVLLLEPVPTFKLPAGQYSTMDRFVCIWPR